MFVIYTRSRLVSQSVVCVHFGYECRIPDIHTGSLPNKFQKLDGIGGVCPEVSVHHLPHLTLCTHPIKLFTCFAQGSSCSLSVDESWKLKKKMIYRVERFLFIITLSLFLSLLSQTCLLCNGIKLNEKKYTWLNTNDPDPLQNDTRCVQCCGYSQECYGKVDTTPTKRRSGS